MPQKSKFNPEEKDYPLLGVSLAGYYKWLMSDKSQPELENEAL